MILHRIISIEHTAPLTLRCTFDDGLSMIHNFRQEIEQYPESSVITALGEETLFKTAQIVRSGRAIEWANGYDVCADQWRLWSELAEQSHSSRDELALTA